MERRLYDREGSPVKIVRILESSDCGITIQAEKFMGFGKDNQEFTIAVTRFYPWTSVDYIETEG